MSSRSGSPASFSRSSSSGSSTSPTRAAANRPLRGALRGRPLRGRGGANRAGNVVNARTQRLEALRNYRQHQANARRNLLVVTEDSDVTVSISDSDEEMSVSSVGSDDSHQADDNTNDRDDSSSDDEVLPARESESSASDSEDAVVDGGHQAVLNAFLLRQRPRACISTPDPARQRQRDAEARSRAVAHLADDEADPPSRRTADESQVIRSSEHGHCNICFEDSPFDPVGCLICRQLIGCRKCVDQWHKTGVEKRERKEANADNHFQCPLCRHPWDTMPEVDSIFAFD